jgi:carotenoid cleavage dioxygenase-like enzyme
MSAPIKTDNPMLNGPFAPIQMECDAPDLYVEGEIPKDLCGSFYRCGPNVQFAPRDQDAHHLFGGDGMVHGFHIKDGRVRYNNRWVKTTKWKVEHDVGRNVFNAMSPMDCEPEYADIIFTDKDGLANTSPVWHGGKLLITEETHLPIAVDPDTLETKGAWDFFGKVRTAMTAHPKKDPKTGELFLFAYMSKDLFSPDVTVYTVNEAGHVTHSVSIDTPYPAMIHDFVVTENYIMIPLMPLTASMERAMSGLPPIAWEPEKPTRVAILPRHNGTAEDVRWIESDTRFVFHFMNGFENDGVLTYDLCEFERAPLFPNADGTAGENIDAKLHRWTIDLNDPNARVQSKCINDLPSEFPQIDPRYAGEAYRYGVFITPEDPDVDEAFYNALCRFDHKTGDVERYNFGPGRVTTESIFVPRSDAAPEGDGYILSVVFNPDTNTSELDVFDSQCVSKGPIAVAKLSHRVPLGFHGGWRPGSE